MTTQTPLQQHIAAEIRAEMARSERRQADLAELLGISQQSASRRLRGRMPWAIDELVRTAEWLGISLDSLMPAVPEQSRTGT